MIGTELSVGAPAATDMTSTITSAVSGAISNPVVLPAAAVAATAALAVGIGVTIEVLHDKYEVHVARKQRRLMREINQILTDSTKDIIIPNTYERIVLPTPFKITKEEGKKTECESIHLTDDQIRSSGRMPEDGKYELDEYRAFVVMAINSLIKFHIERYRKDKETVKDITAGVISYLIYIIDEYCLKFFGYDKEIAYLDAIAEFAVGVASLSKSMETEHYSRFKDVARYLIMAKKKLIAYRAKLSLTDVLAQLKDGCRRHSQKLFRQFIKCVVPEKDWELVDFENEDDLRVGIINPEFVKRSLLGFSIWNTRVVYASSSIFKDWIQSLAAHFMSRPNFSTTTKIKIPHPEEIFVVPDLARLRELREKYPWYKPVDPKKAKKTKKKSKDKKEEVEVGSEELAEREELAKLERQFSEIKDVFKVSKNFVTTRLDLRTNRKGNKFILIQEDQDVFERTKILGSFAKLCYEIMSMQYICIELLSAAAKLGDLYISYPNHFRYLFAVLEALSASIQDGIKDINSAFSEIEEQNDNQPGLIQVFRFNKSVRRTLDDLANLISTQGGLIAKMRENSKANITALNNQIEVVKMKAFAVSNAIAEAYHLTVNVPPSDMDPRNEKDMPGEPVSLEAAEPAQPVHPSQLALVEDDDNLSEASDDVTGFFESFMREAGKIYDQLLLIEQNNSFAFLREKLAILQSQCIRLSFEKKPVDANLLKDRQDKLTQFQRLAKSLVHETYQYLSLSAEARKDNAKSFEDKLNELLSNPDNAIIAKHKNPGSKVLFTIFRVKSLATRSQQAVDGFSAAARA